MGRRRRLNRVPGPSQRLRPGSRLKYRTTNYGGFTPFDRYRNSLGGSKQNCTRGACGCELHIHCGPGEICTTHFGCTHGCQCVRTNKNNGQIY